MRLGRWVSRVTPRVWTSLLLLYVALVFWTLALEDIQIRDIDTMGLGPVLPPLFWCALVLLNLGFIIALVAHQNARWPLVLYIAALLLILYGTPAFLEYGPRTQSAWRAAGIVDYIMTYEQIDRNIDVFFNWPGIFVFLAFLAGALGISSTLTLAEWAPLFFNAIYLIPLALILRRITASSTHVWIGVWLFCLANWIGQDYLAPQAVAYFLYLTIIALLITYFRRDKRTDAEEAAVTQPPRASGDLAPYQTPRRRLLLLGCIIVLFAALVPSHQLTPWMIALSAGAVVIARRTIATGLPALMVIMALSWLVFATGPYLDGHGTDVAAPVASISGNVQANLGGRLKGSADHRTIVRLRIAFTLSILLLAGLGAYRMRKLGLPLRTALVLGLTPFLALTVQRYGGELLLRIYMFALPFALGLASALYVGREAPPRIRRAPLLATCLLFSVLFVFARYGNEKADYFTREEARAVEFLYSTARSGDSVRVAVKNLPWLHKRYDDFDLETLDEHEALGPISGALSELEEARTGADAYLILTRSQGAQGELLEGWPADAVNKLRARAMGSPRLRLLFSNRDSAVFRLQPTLPERIRSSGALPAPESRAALAWAGSCSRSTPCLPPVPPQQ